MNRFDFSLPDVSGKTISLDSYKNNKGLIVVFSCNHCPYVIGSESRMIDWHLKYQALGFPLVAINSNDPIQYPDDSFEKMILKSTQKKFPFNYLFDESQLVAKNYSAERTPHVFVLTFDHAGETHLVYSGSMDDNPKVANDVKEKHLETVMSALISGKPAPFNYKPALGCTIKWKKPYPTT